jgi:hypothetical protein
MYEFDTSQGASTVEVRFSELPIAEWHELSSEQKRSHGITGGAGVSIVRAGREIDYGWYLMGSKRRENYDDWWRCEIRFSPRLDELFGVTHSKQGVVPTPELKFALGSDLEATARTLNSRVRATFGRLRAGAPSAAETIASARDRFLPPVPAPLGAVHASGLSYRFASDSLRGPEFYQAVLNGDTVTVTLNRDHPFYSRVYQSAQCNARSGELHRIQCLLVAAARADLSVQGSKERECIQRVRRAWGDALAVFLGS